ncbi:MAG: ThuA domain-containing protein [Planctomycetota bacterium]
MLTALATLAALNCLLVGAQPSPDQGTQLPENGIRVLIVSGIDWKGHLFKETGPALREVLEKDPRIDVRLVEDADFLSSDAIDKYDVLFLHFKNYLPLLNDDAAKKKLTEFVGNGKGLVVFHFAQGAFPEWPEFEKLAGRTFLWGASKHDKRGPFSVRIADPQHPITRGLQDFEIDDELYHTLHGDTPIHVVATARSNMTGKDEPIAFVLEYGKGRVFHTPLGHDVKAITNAGAAELIRRGTVWAGGRE